MRSKIFNVCLFILATLLYCKGQERDISAFLQSDLLSHSQVGLYAKEITQGEVVAAHNEAQGLIPASNVKLFTTALGWKVMGPDFSFVTRFYVEKGVDGEARHLIIRGNGDPTLASEKWPDRSIENLFDQVVLSLQSKDIDTLGGDIVIVSGPWKREWHHPDWPWSDLGNYYGIGAGSVNVYENAYTLTFDTRKAIGQKAEIKSIAPLLEMEFINYVTIGPPNSGDQAFIFGNALDNRRVIRGTVPKSGETFSIRGSSPDPERIFGQILRKALMERGIFVSGDIIIQTDHEGGSEDLLLEYHSPPLTEILEYINKNSHNLFAEAVYKYFSLQEEARMKLILSEWNREGISIEKLRWKDGSGLSPFNRFTAKDFALLMQQMSEQETFVQTLAMPGREGTLKYRFSGTDGLYAKTGSIEGVYALSGLLMANEKKIAFSILVNNFYGSTRLLDQEIQKLFRSWLQ